MRKASHDHHNECKGLDLPEIESPTKYEPAPIIVVPQAGMKGSRASAQISQQHKQKINRLQMYKVNFK